MPKWTDYTIKTEPADKDEVMILDTSGKANKRLGLSALSDWIIGKIASKVFENLQTQNKTILGAINELNSKAQIEDITKFVTTNEDVTVTTASAVNIGNFTIIQFEINVLNTIPSKTQLIMNIPTRAPYTNMIAGVVIESKSLENNYIYVDRYSNSVGGISIVTAKSLPTGNCRGNVAFISTSK